VLGEIMAAIQRLDRQEEEETFVGSKG